MSSIKSSNASDVSSADGQGSSEWAAAELGIVWERPAGDNRSASYILENNDLLRNLGNQEGLRDKLKELVGDFENDPDAAYRASQVLEHVERFDASGNIIAGKTVGDGKINGVTSSGDVKHGTEAGRLKDLFKYGWDNLKGDLGNRAATYKDPQTALDAAALGINWTRPEDDTRSAREIIDATPALKNLDNSSGVKDLLKDQVGDFETDADAAYRASKVIEHIEHFDGNGDAIVGSSVGDGKVGGFTSSGEARHGTEAGRLQDFGKYGFTSLKGELPDRIAVADDGAARSAAEALGINWTRPEGDTRSAGQILADTPLLANLGNESGTRDLLKDQVGDFDTDADAAYRAAQVLEHIESLDSSGSEIVGKTVGNNDINGFTSSGEAKHGTEAGRLQDFGKYGFEALQGELTDRAAIGADEATRAKAEALGINWELSEGDDRSASEIIGSSDLLSQLGNQSGVRDMLKDQVGDFETDANAAYRAVQVLEHIERRDGEGAIIASNDVGNGRIDGFTSSSEAKNGTEAGRLQDFGKYGFDSLKGELTSVSDDTRAQAAALGITWERLEGDTRSADEIIQETPLLRDLGNQSGVSDMLRERVGDYTSDADAAWRAAQLLEHIEAFSASGATTSGGDEGNGRIDGFTSSSEAKPFTEAARLQDFGKYGFGALEGTLPDRTRNGGAPVADEAAKREQAEALGIIWERPLGDYRSAEEILESNDLLANLGNQEDVRSMLKEQVGDFETDADAAFRAVQVLDHIERFDESGQAIVGGDVGDGRVNGFTSSGEARHGTEAGRLKDFGEQGFGFLQGSFKDVSAAGDNTQAQARAEALGIEWQRPEGDARSAAEIVHTNETLSNLGNQSGVAAMLKEQVGDYEHDADAAYRAEQVVEHIQRFDSDGNEILGKSVGDGVISGFTSSDEARHGTEAGRLQDFGKYGFDSLKGKLPDETSVAGNAAERALAEAVGITWERPEGDDRSAAQIINDSPLLRNLGNQSGVRDMLKDRVGDFEADADAAYRAVQVLENVETYNSGGGFVTGGDEGNGRIDGFTSSGEAKHGTEAGRLQDFGKYGFAALDNAGAGGKVSDFAKNNPEADAASRQIVEYASVLYESFDDIREATGAGDYIRVSDLQSFQSSHPDLPDSLNEAIDFWTNPGAFEQLETSVDKLRYPSDGLLTKEDINAWLENAAPVSVSEAVSFLSTAAQNNSLSNLFVDSIGPEIFENPDRYSVEEKAAVVQDLQEAYLLVAAGQSNKMWEGDWLTKITSRTDLGDDPEAVLSEIQSRIDQLTGDPEVTSYLSEITSSQFSDILADAPALQADLQTAYEEEILSGAELDRLWSDMETANADLAEGEAPQTQMDALSQFYSAAADLQGALGLDDIKALQDAVASSAVGGDLQSYYINEIASGNRLDELLETADDPVAAFEQYSAEVAVFTTTMPAELTEQYEEVVQSTLSDRMFEYLNNEVTVGDMYALFGVNGGEALDEEKVLAFYDQIIAENPDLAKNENGQIAGRDDYLKAVRGLWDTMRQTTKTLDKANALGAPVAANEYLKTGLDTGVMHMVSGLLYTGLVVMEGQDAAADGIFTAEEIGKLAISSTLAASLLLEGGIKGYKTFATQAGFISSIAQANEVAEIFDKGKATASKISGWGGIVSGAAGLASAVWGMIDAAATLKSGDKVNGALAMTNGAVWTAASIINIVEGVYDAFAIARGATMVSAITGVMGVVGAVANIVSAAAMIAMEIIKEVQQNNRQNDYADLLGEYLDKYQITGKEVATA